LLTRSALLLVGTEPVDLLLGHTDHHDALVMPKSCEPPPRHVLLSLMALELDERDLVPCGEPSDVRNEGIDPLLK